MDPLFAAHEMNVQIVVDGSIQKFGSRLRVHGQAWNASDSTTLLTGKYDSEMAALFELQGQVAAALAGSLGLKESDWPPAEPATQNPRVYELFLRAVERLSRVNRWDTRTAIEMLEDATRLDPKFTDAWARLAGACVFMGGTFDLTPKWYRKGEQAMRRALALNPTDSEALCARGCILWTPLKGYKNRQALLNLSESLEENPGYHPALVWRSLILLHCGVHEEAIDGLKEALAAHPDDGFTLTFLGQVYQFCGDYSEAERYFRRALSLDPSSLWANLFSPRVSLFGPNPENAVEILQTAQQVVPGDAMLRAWEGPLWAKRGETRKAKEIIRKALKVGKSVLHTHHMWHTTAATYSTLGMPAEAVRLLARADRRGLPNYPLFRDDPHFKPLQIYPPFLQMLVNLKKETNAYRREFGNPSLLD